MYTDKGEADNPQTAERVFKMTIERMKDIAKDRMELQISFFSRNVISFDELFATLLSFKCVELFTDAEYLDYVSRIRQIHQIRQTENERISQNDF